MSTRYLKEDFSSTEDVEEATLCKINATELGDYVQQIIKAAGKGFEFDQHIDNYPRKMAELYLVTLTKAVEKKTVGRPKKTV